MLMLTSEKRMFCLPFHCLVRFCRKRNGRGLTWIAQSPDTPKKQKIITLLACFFNLSICLKNCGYTTIIIA